MSAAYNLGVVQKYTFQLSYGTELHMDSGFQKRLHENMADRVT